MVETGILRRDGRRGELTAGEGTGVFYERHEVNANIESTGRSVAVVDGLTGRVVGKIQERDLGPRDSFALGGSRLDVVRQEGRSVFVDLGKAEGTMRKLRYRSRDRILPFDLAQILGAKAWAVRGELPAFRVEETWFVLHSVGDVYGRILSALLRQETGWKSGAAGLFLKAKERPPAGHIFAPGGSGVRGLAEAQYQALELMLGLGKFQKQLPEGLRRRTVGRACLPSRFCEKLGGLRLSLVGDAGVIDRPCELL